MHTLVEPEVTATGDAFVFMRVPDNVPVHAYFCVRGCVFSL